MSAEILLEAREVSCSYGRHRAVSALSLRVARGECLGLLGLNGAGKSSTLSMLAGVRAPSDGRILIGGLDLQTEPLAARRRLGYLPDVPPLFAEMRVEEYLGFCADLRAVPQRADAVARASARCGLQDVGTRQIRSLSKGYQQRIGIAQAIVHEPEVVILDEPSVGLDPRQLHEIRALVKALAADRAVVLSSHLLAEIESTCTRVAILHHGQLVHEAPVAAGQLQLVLVLRDTAPRATRLAAIDGVLAVSAGGTGRWVLDVRDDQVAEAIARAALDEQWGLRRLEALTSPLEATFLALTVKGDVACLG